MADENTTTVKTHEFLDIDGVSVLKTEIDKVIDASEQNARNYANSLSKNYDEAGAANTAEQNAKDYVMSLFEWQDF